MTSLVEEIKAILNNENGGTWTAGTLWTDGYRVSFNSYAERSDDNSYSGNRETAGEAKYFFSKLYISSKTPNHSYYDRCKNFIAEFEVEIEKALGIE